MTTFEIYSFKNGDWMIDSVHDDKQMALHQARMLLESPHHMAIRVLQEVYDDEADKSMSSVVFKQQKGDDKRKKTPPPAKKKKSDKFGAGATKTKPKKKKKSSFTRTIVLMALALGGVGLGLIAIIGALISAFS
jgi:hypothetical protein